MTPPPTPDDFDGLLRQLEQDIEIDADAKIEAKRRMLAAARAAGGPASAGTAEIVRLGQTPRRQLHPRSRAIVGVAAALLTVIAVGVITTLRTPEVTTPAASVPATRETLPPVAPPTTVPSLPDGSSSTDRGRYATRLGTLDLTFEVDDGYALTSASSDAFTLKLVDNPQAGAIHVMVDGEYVDADDLESWLDDREVDVQQTVVDILGETREFVTILGAPTNESCDGSACSLLRVESLDVEVVPQRGSLTHVVEIDVAGSTLTIVAIDSAGDGRLRRTAQLLARSLESAG